MKVFSGPQNTNDVRFCVQHNLQGFLRKPAKDGEERKGIGTLLLIGLMGKGSSEQHFSKMLP